MDKTMMTLLPCPHCGENLVEKGDHHGNWWGHNNDVGSCIHAVTQLMDDEDFAAWNRRSALEPSQAGEVRGPGSLHELLMDARNCLTETSARDVDKAFNLVVQALLIVDRRARATPPDCEGLREALAKIARLEEALRRYGDRTRMAWAPAELQSDIDAALSGAQAKGER